MSRFFVIRHASFDGVGRVIRGHTAGIPLNERGRAEAARLANLLAPAGIVRICSSPLERAVQTAAPLATRLGLQISTVPGLIELDWGEWTGRTVDELRDNPEFQRFNTLRGTSGAPGGELMVEAQARAVRAIEDVRRQERPDAVIAVFTHADIVRALLCSYLGAPLDHLLRFEIAPASVTVIDVTDGHIAVPFVNIGADVFDTFRTAAV